MPITELASTVLAVRQGVEDKAADASAEELAYLASATEKIGGAATLLDVVEAGEDAINAINQLVASRTAELTAHADTAETSLTTLAETTEAALTAHTTARTSELTTHSTTITNELTAHSTTITNELTAHSTTITTELTAHTTAKTTELTEHAASTLTQLQTDVASVRDNALDAITSKRAVLARELAAIQPRPGARALFYSLI